MSHIPDDTAGGAAGPRAAEELVPLVYEALRGLAHQLMSTERLDHTLQPTALVHEAYARLAGAGGRWSDRAHFFRAASETMRRILIDYARGRARVKRGGTGRTRIDLDLGNVVALARDGDPEEILTLDDAICRLGEQDPRAGAVVRHRFYAGLSVEETAEALEISVKTVKRDWSFARAWLARELKSDEGPRTGIG